MPAVFVVRLEPAEDGVQRVALISWVWAFQYVRSQSADEEDVANVRVMADFVHLPMLPGDHLRLLRRFRPHPRFDSFRCYYHGKTFTLFPPHIPLTSSNIVRIIASSPTKPEQHFAVPYVLKLLAETEEGTRCLAGFEAVSFAGAAVPDDLGDRLVGAGVNLFSVYGTTGESWWRKQQKYMPR